MIREGGKAEAEDNGDGETVVNDKIKEGNACPEDANKIKEENVCPEEAKKCTNVFKNESPAAVSVQLTKLWLEVIRMAEGTRERKRVYKAEDEIPQ